jgi:hypothetical protein
MEAEFHVTWITRCNRAGISCVYRGEQLPPPMRNFLLPLFLLGALFTARAQDDVSMAYTVAPARVRAAEVVRIEAMETAVPGMIELTLPPSTYRVDLLNPRGRVKRSLVMSGTGTLDTRNLYKGTWTLRAHTEHGMVVRRFMKADLHTVLWETPRPVRKR